MSPNLQATVSWKKVASEHDYQTFLLGCFVAAVMLTLVQVLRGNSTWELIPLLLMAGATAIIVCIIVACVSVALRLELSDGGVLFSTPWGRRAYVEWEKIEEIQPAWGGGFYARASGKKFYFYPHYYHQQQQVAEFFVRRLSDRVHLPDDIWLLAAVAEPKG